MIGLSSMKQLDKSLIHNLAAECRVWFVNYELSGRGSKQLAAVSSAQVKAKSADLPENRPSGSFRDYSRISKTKMPDRPIISSWNTKEEELKQQAMENKENANVAADRWRNKDHNWTPWAEHKSDGLPFGRANLMFILQALRLFRLWPTYFLNLITHCRQKSFNTLKFHIVRYISMINLHWKYSTSLPNSATLLPNLQGACTGGLIYLNCFLILIFL